MVSPSKSFYSIPPRQKRTQILERKSRACVEASRLCRNMYMDGCEYAHVHRQLHWRLNHTRLNSQAHSAIPLTHEYRTHPEIKASIRKKKAQKMRQFGYLIGNQNIHQSTTNKNQGYCKNNRTWLLRRPSLARLPGAHRSYPCSSSAAVVSLL